MATAGPTITGVTRHPSDPTILQVTYTVPVSGVTRVQLWERPQSGGTPVRIVDTSTLNGNISVHSRYAANVAVALHMTLTHATEGASNAGGTVNVPAFTVATPTLVSATRASATQATLTFSGLTVGMGSRCYIYRSAPGGNPVQVDAFNITVSSGSRNAPAPNGTAAYEYEIRVGQHGILSAPSARRSVEAWYQTPPAPVSFSATRNASTGRVTLTFGAPTVTSRNRWTGVRIFRAFKGQPLKAWRTVSGAGQTVYDDTTVLSSAYDYGVESYNETGPSSSRPTASVDAVRERPNAASGLTVTHLGGDRYQLSWTTTPTTERPITSQKILARVPGQTATTTLATASGTVTTHIVTLAANRVYEVAVVPTNGVGDAASTSNWAGPIVSTPLGVTSLSALWQDASTVRVSWPLRAASIGDVLEIEFSTEANPDPDNAAHWSPLGSVANWRTVGQATQASASQLVPHTYRARARHTDSGQVSSWIYSARLDGQATPLAPTMLMPPRIDATMPIALRMRHNPVDGTPQTLGQIRYRRQGLTTWTTRTVGTSTLYNLAANTYTNGDLLEVQGRTAGGTGVYGVWSDTLLIPLQPVPVVTIVSPLPDAVVEAQDVVVEWEADKQASARVRLWQDAGSSWGVPAEILVGADARRVVFEGIPDGAGCLVEVAVSDPWQGSSAQVQFSVEYNLPAPPLLSAQQAEAASVLLQATPRDALELERLSHVTAARSWAPDDLDAHVGTSTLSLPDEGEVETITLSGDIVSDTFSPPPVSLAAGFRAWSETGATVHLWAEAPGVSNTDGVTVVIPPRSASWVRMHTATAGTGNGDLHVTVSDGDMIHTWDHYVIGQPRPGAPDDSYFDAGSVREGYVYGWLSGGVAYEAVPSDDPTYPVAVAPTVRIEIWCSDTGLPGSYTRCGETGAEWDYHDRHPRIGVPIWYVARAVAASGAWAESEPVQVVVESDSAWLHFGPDRRLSVHGGWNPTLTASGGRSKTRKRYAGHDRDVTYYGSRKARTISAQISILPGEHGSSREEWLEASELAETVLYRDPAGQLMEGDLDGVSWSGSHDLFQQVSFTVTESA